MAVLVDGPGAVRELRGRYGLTEEDISRATGASLSTVRRWNVPDKNRPADRGRRATNYDEKIDDLATLIEILSEEYPPAVVVAWLRGRCSALDYERPLDVLAGGRDDAFGRVRSAAHAAILGDPA